MSGGYAVTLSVLVAATLGACAMAGGVATNTEPSAPGQPARRPTSHTDARARNIRRSANNQALTLTQLAGQRVIYAYTGLQPPQSLLTLIRAGDAAGVILFSDNIANIPQIRAVTRQLQSASAESPLRAPLLILTDQEGGEVRRLPGAPVLSERQIGMTADDVSQAYNAGAGAASNLIAAGINTNLAPVLDVYRQPGDFIDEFQRSYSRNPRVVANLGKAFISAEQRRPVAATAKHFPGLGAAARNQNTDSGPVTLNLSLTQLRRTDELPYLSAIAAGVKMVMTSWAIYPALDPRLPAGLSPTVIQRELRHRLGFKGITITDAITARALTRFGPLGQRAILAARAGADLILCSALNPSSDTPADGIAVLHALKSAFSTGQLSTAAARQAAAAVMALRRHL